MQIVLDEDVKDPQWSRGIALRRRSLAKYQQPQLRAPQWSRGICAAETLLPFVLDPTIILTPQWSRGLNAAET